MMAEKQHIQVKTSEESAAEQTELAAGEYEQNNTRAWMFDALMECGQKLAMANHLEEKINGIRSKMDETEDVEEAYALGEKLAHMQDLVQMVSDDRRKLMDYIMSEAGAAEDEERCLLKHALLDYTIACELYEVDTKNSELENNMLATSQTLAGVISLTLGLEFATCMRCLADKYKK